MNYIETHFPKSPYICKRKKCKYHTGCTTGAKESCNFFFITGATKHSLGVTDWQECRLYEAGKRMPVMIQRPFGSLQAPTPRPSKYDWVKGRELYEAGLTDAKIAAALGCSADTVLKWRQREDLETKHGQGREKINADTDESNPGKVP